jgi:hypothetical protein
MQELIIFLVFAVAIGFLANRAYKSFSKKEAGCGKGCGCAADTKALGINKEKKTTVLVD